MSDEDKRRDIHVIVDGERVACERGQSLLSALLKAGKRVETSCGGNGTCHLCRVTISSPGGDLPAPRSAEKRALGNVLLAQGMRLSCQIDVTDGLAVSLPAVETPAERRARKKRRRGGSR